MKDRDLLAAIQLTEMLSAGQNSYGFGDYGDAAREEINRLRYRVRQELDRRATVAARDGLGIEDPQPDYSQSQAAGPYGAGYRAAKTGLTNDSQPYACGTMDAVNWARGHRDGSSEDSSAYVKGWEAAGSGIDHTSCPYVYGSTDGQEWLRGHRDFRADQEPPVDWNERPPYATGWEAARAGKSRYFDCPYAPGSDAAKEWARGHADRRGEQATQDHG